MQIISEAGSLGKEYMAELEKVCSKQTIAIDIDGLCNQNREQLCKKLAKIYFMLICNL